MESWELDLRRQTPEARQGSHVKGAHFSQNWYLRDERLVNARIALVERTPVVRFVELGAQRTTDKQIQSPDMINLAQLGTIWIVDCGVVVVCVHV